MTMFGKHRGRGRHEHHGRHRNDGWAGDEREHRSGRGRERMFEQGDLKLVVLHLLTERPRHGYEIIKAIEDLAGGEYSPSAGVIYPTLTLLEELGQATVTVEQGGKKQYGVTAEGSAVLETQRDTLERILRRLGSAGSVADARRAPELQRSMQNFRTALHFRLSRGGLDPVALRAIADAIDRAAVDIERS
jgi:DNA-binding PadR family transcriptional regulator